MNYIKTFTQPDTSEVSPGEKPSDAMMKPLPMTGEAYGRWCGKTAPRPTTVQGARKERFYLSSGTSVALFALYRFGGPPV